MNKMDAEHRSSLFCSCGINRANQTFISLMYAYIYRKSESDARAPNAHTHTQIRN